MVSAPSPPGPLGDGTTAAAELMVSSITEVRMWPDAWSGVAYGVTKSPLKRTSVCGDVRTSRPCELDMAPRVASAYGVTNPPCGDTRTKRFDR